MMLFLNSYWMFSYYPLFYSVDFMNPPYKRGRCKSLLPNPTRKMVWKQPTTNFLIIRLL
jgi:hypothetical protein